MNPEVKQAALTSCSGGSQRHKGLWVMAIVPATHLGLRVAPGAGAGFEDVDLVVPTPEPEQGVSDGGLAEKIQVSLTCLRDHVTSTCHLLPLTQDISSTRKLADGVFCTSHMVLQP